MRTSSTPRRGGEGTVLFVGTAAALASADDLVAAHAAQRSVRTVAARRGSTGWRRSLGDVAAVVLLADPEMPVAEATDGTHVHDDGRPVPIGVLPHSARAIRAAAEVQRRGLPGSRLSAGPVVLLSSREAHVRVRAERIAAVLATGPMASRALPSGRADRRGVLAALARGPGLVIYTGLGDARGWRGYGRIQSWELDRPDALPIGALVSLSCSGSARLGSIRGLSEVVVERGSAASALGAVTDVRRSVDEAIGSFLAERLVSGAGSLAAALTPPPPELADFRISGDPLAPLIGARGSRAALQRTVAPAIGEPLQPVAWS